MAFNVAQTPKCLNSSSTAVETSFARKDCSLDMEIRPGAFQRPGPFMMEKCAKDIGRANMRRHDPFAVVKCWNALRQRKAASAGLYRKDTMVIAVRTGIIRCATPERRWFVNVVMKRLLSLSCELVIFATAFFTRQQPQSKIATEIKNEANMQQLPLRGGDL